MGVIMVACFTTIAISFMPPRAVRRVFPPMISGITIFCELRSQAASILNGVVI
jgi:xanthine/uracil permease